MVGAAGEEQGPEGVRLRRDVKPSGVYTGPWGLCQGSKQGWPWELEREDVGPRGRMSSARAGWARPRTDPDPRPSGGPCQWGISDGARHRVLEKANAVVTQEPIRGDKCAGGIHH